MEQRGNFFLPTTQAPTDPGGASYLQSWALAGTRATSWLMILFKLPSGNPGARWAPSRTGTLCFHRTTGTTLKRIVLQPLDTSSDRCSSSSHRLSTFREPAMAALLAPHPCLTLPSQDTPHLGPHLQAPPYPQHQHQPGNSARHGAGPAGACTTVMGRIVSPKTGVEVLTPSSSDCDCIWS